MKLWHPGRRVVVEATTPEEARGCLFLRVFEKDGVAAPFAEVAAGLNHEDRCGVDFLRIGESYTSPTGWVVKRVV